jgi:hypothetical protein
MKRKQGTVKWEGMVSPKGSYQVMHHAPKWCINDAWHSISGQWLMHLASNITVALKTSAYWHILVHYNDIIACGILRWRKWRISMRCYDWWFSESDLIVLPLSSEMHAVNNCLPITWLVVEFKTSMGPERSALSLIVDCVPSLHPGIWNHIKT